MPKSERFTTKNAVDVYTARAVTVRLDSLVVFNRFLVVVYKKHTKRRVSLSIII